MNKNVKKDAADTLLSLRPVYYHCLKIIII